MGDFGTFGGATSRARFGSNLVSGSGQGRRSNLGSEFGSPALRGFCFRIQVGRVSLKGLAASLKVSFGGLL